MALNENLRSFGSHLAKLRVSKGLSQSELARRMGKDQQSYQRVESGNINPTLEYLQEVAKVLDLNMSELFKGFE